MEVFDGGIMLTKAFLRRYKMVIIIKTTDATAISPAVVEITICDQTAHLESMVLGEGEVLYVERRKSRSLLGLTHGWLGCLKCPQTSLRQLSSPKFRHFVFVASRSVA